MKELASGKCMENDCFLRTLKFEMFLWKTAFFLEFSLEKGIHKNKKAEDQVNFKRAIRRVLFRYFKFMFPTKALARTLALFATYLDKDSEDCMFTNGILKA
jgi:hypothetical protein